MKILPVSNINFKSQVDKKNYDLSYLYTLTEQQQKNYIPMYAALTAIAAVSAVSATLFNIGHKKQFPFSIVEISDAAKGLNKIKNNDKLVESLKTDFIYPIKAFISGDKKIKFKSGLILTGQKEETLSEISSGLIEHFNKLGIYTVNISDVSTRLKDNKLIEKKLRRNDLNKKVLKEVEHARMHFEETGKYTVLNLGNLDLLTDFKVVKSQKSKFEKLISNISSDKNNGVIWVGTTEKEKAVPLFLSYLPVLIKK